jgi:hypothetical protein
MGRITYLLGVPPKLMKEVKAAAKETGLSVADVIRQAIKFGVPRVRQHVSREEDFAAAGAHEWEKIGPGPDIIWEKLPKRA